MMRNFEQQDLLVKSLADYGKYFYPSVGNNYSLMIISRKHDIDTYKLGVKTDFFALNKANMNLRRLFTIILDDLNESSYYCKNPLLKELRTINSAWEKHNQNGSFYLTHNYAIALMDGLKALNHPIEEKKYEHGIVKRLFVEVPDKVKAFLRINLFIKFSEVYDFFELFIKNICHDKKLYDLIDRIDIALETYEEQTAFLDKEFSTFNIYLDSAKINTWKSKQLDLLLKTLNQMVEPYTENKVASDYSFFHSKNISVIQGHTNYKRFLKTLNFLDDVYDKDYNYAFLLQ